MTRNPAKADLACLAVGLVIVATGISVMFAGPTEPMPVHYGLDGQADRWGGRLEVGGMIAALGAVATAVCGLVGLSAQRAPDAARARSLRVAQIVLVVVFLALALFAGGSALAGVESLGSDLPMLGISLLLVSIGAFLGRIGPNPVIGVRTPWTYKSRLAWDRANRLAGRLLFLIGLAGLGAAAFVPQPAGMIGLFCAIVIATVWAVFESWRVWRDDPERQPF